MDLVLNVEATHNFAEPRMFAAEVSRVLNPGGYLVWTDCMPSFTSKDMFGVIRKINLWALRRKWAKIFEDQGLTVCCFEDLTQGVAEACRRDEVHFKNVSFAQKKGFSLSGLAKSKAVAYGSGRAFYLMMVAVKK